MGQKLSTGLISILIIIISVATILVIVKGVRFLMNPEEYIKTELGYEERIFRCPKHGIIDSDPPTIRFSDDQRFWCFKCFTELLNNNAYLITGSTPTNSTFPCPHHHYIIGDTNYITFRSNDHIWCAHCVEEYFEKHINLVVQEGFTFEKYDNDEVAFKTALKTPIYYCPKHDTMEGFVYGVSFNSNKKFCAKCLVEFIEQHCHEAERIK